MPGRAALERKERKPALPTPRPQASGPQTERKPVSVVPAARLRRLYTATPAGWWNPWAFPTFSLPIFVGGAGVDHISGSTVGTSLVGRHCWDVTDGASLMGRHWWGITAGASLVGASLMGRH